MRYNYYGGYLAGGVFTLILIGLLIYVAVNFITRWNMFIKAGEAGWKCLIPIYSDYIEWKIAGFGKEFIRLLLLGIGLILLALLFSLLGVFGIIVSSVAWIVFVVLALVITIRKCMRLSYAFGQTDTFGLLGLFLFSDIGRLILSWGQCTYTAPAQRVDEQGNVIDQSGTMITGIFKDIKAGRAIDL